MSFSSCKSLRFSFNTRVVLIRMQYGCSVRFKVGRSPGSGWLLLLHTDHLTDCLAKNLYKEEKCQKRIDSLYKCCKIFYERQGDGATTASCPKSDLLKLKMKQRSQGI